MNQFQIYGIYAMNQCQRIKIFPCFEELVDSNPEILSDDDEIIKRLLKNLLIPALRFSIWRGCQLQKESIFIFIRRKTSQIS